MKECKRKSRSYDLFGGLPGGSEGKDSVCRLETRVRCLGQEDPLEKEMTIHSSNSCLENPMHRRALEGLQSTGGRAKSPEGRDKEQTDCILVGFGHTAPPVG